jgi:hypothetical protein
MSKGKECHQGAPRYFSKKPPFINRVAEKKYFLEYFNSAPTNILFVYRPKST